MKGIRVKKVKIIEFRIIGVDSCLQFSNPQHYFPLQSATYSAKFATIYKSYFVEVISDFAPIIEIIEKAYKIPQLGRKRRIAALLPHDYHSSNKKYPVLYLNDGQNLFDENAPFGNWAIDKELENMAREGFGDIIVITIDHGGEDRIIEYLPYFNPKYGKGEGAHYLQFLEVTLIPYINKTYRTLTDSENTGIGGSSMGGLISLFAGLNYQTTFSKLMVFSPSLWIAPKIFQQAGNFKPELPIHLYIYAGGHESANHLPNVLRLKNLLFGGKKHFENLDVHIELNPEGTHSEYFWRQEFPKAVKWLFFKTEPQATADEN